MIPDEAVEAAALGIHTGGGVSVPEAREYARAALEFAAPHLMFSGQAVERAAIALCVKRYPMTDGFWDDVDADFQEKCRDQARTVIAALKGDDQ